MAADERSRASTLLKTTKAGRPFVKDTLDLFATLIVSLRLGPHKQFFRTYLNTFTTDEAIQHLAKLKFSQSNRHPDPNDPSRVITTTTITTFSMSPEMAMTMSQHFMDARLMINAADTASNVFSPRGIYIISPKGLHVLERFISKNGISVADHLQSAFTTQPICDKLLHVERSTEDDEIIISQPVVTTLFRRFVGRAPNFFNTKNLPLDRYAFQEGYSKGIPLKEQTITTPTGATETHKYCFSATSALEWLCEFISLAGRDEAAEVAAHFVRFGFLALVSDKQKDNESIVSYTVRGPVQDGNTMVSRQGEFRCTSKAVYKITSEGMRAADWTRPAVSTSSSSTSLEAPSTNEGSESKKHTKESNITHLRHILKTPQLRSAFTVFLRNNYCEENLLFYLDVQNLRKKFFVSSSAVAANPSTTTTTTTQHSSSSSSSVKNDAENHHTALLNTAFGIYDTYLAPASPRELNLDSASRTVLAKHRESARTTGGGGPGPSGRVWNTTELRKMIALYEDISGQVMRLMASDSVPKFMHTTEFVGLRYLLFDAEDDASEEGAEAMEESEAFSPALLQVQGQQQQQQQPNGEKEPPRGGVYVTISQIAKENSALKVVVSSS